MKNRELKFISLGLILLSIVTGCKKIEPSARDNKTAATANDELTCETRRANHDGNDGGGRIVRGDNARPGSAPWQVEILSSPQYTEERRAYDKTLAWGDRCKYYLNEREDYELSHTCGGSYIGAGWVITAAHCVDNIPGFNGKVGNVLTDRRVRMGTQNLTIDDGIFDINTVIIHKNYNKERKLDDIALIKLNDDARIAKLKASNRLSAIDLMQTTDRDFDRNEQLSVTGWGWMGQRNAEDRVTDLDRDGQLQRNPAQLQQLTVNYIDDEICKRENQNFYGPGILCAGVTGPDGKLQMGKGSCQGDSGGPLTRAADSGGRTLVGIVSGGKGCGADKPTIYTRVSHYTEWIAAAKKTAAEQTGASASVVRQ